MATVLSLTPTGGLSRRGRPPPAHLPKSASPFLSPSLFAVHHSTSALRSTSPSIIVGSAGAFPSGASVSHDFEINPWEVALADHSAHGGGESSAGQDLQVGAGEVDRRKPPSPRSTWEHHAVFGKRGLPSPALVVVHDGGVESVEERRQKRARADDEGLGEGRSDRSRRLSTASRLAYLSPPPLEPTTSTDSSSSEGSLSLAGTSTNAKPSAPKKIKPLSASPSFTIPSLPIAPSPESTDLFSRAHLQHEPRPAPSELRLKTYDLAPRPIDLISSPRLENLPAPTFYATASPSFSPNNDPAPSSTFVPQPESYPAPSPNLPPRPQSIFLPPLSQTPTLTPSARALKAARTPPAPYAAPTSGAVEPKGVSAAPVEKETTAASTAESSEKAAAPKKETSVKEKGKGKAKEPVLDALERNRIAAQKCRAKKKEKVQGLAETEQALSKANASLHNEVSSLQADLAILRSEVEQRHPRGGCACGEVQWWRAQTEAHDAVKAEEAHWEAEGRELRGQQDLAEEEVDELDDEVEMEESMQRGRKREEVEAAAPPAPKRLKK